MALFLAASAAYVCALAVVATDAVVFEAAFDDWSKAFGHPLPYRVVSGSKHVDLVRNAERYGTTLALAA